MATITAPNIEVTRVVTGFMYQLDIAEEESGAGITRIDIGPYIFDGVPPKVQYPEAVTTEMVASGWGPLRWVTDEKGVSWLRFQGGVIRAEDGDVLFQFTSNYPASANSNAHLIVWRGNRSETYDVPVPDYSADPPERNSRHDVTGLGRVYKQTGCMPQVVLTGLTILGVVAWHAMR